MKKLGVEASLASGDSKAVSEDFVASDNPFALSPPRDATLAE
jgi:hypothetical protein